MTAVVSELFESLRLLNEQGQAMLLAHVRTVLQEIFDLRSGARSNANSGSRAWRLHARSLYSALALLSNLSLWLSVTVIKKCIRLWYSDTPPGDRLPWSMLDRKLTCDLLVFLWIFCPLRSQTCRDQRYHRGLWMGRWVIFPCLVIVEVLKPSFPPTGFIRSSVRLKRWKWPFCNHWLQMCRWSFSGVRELRDLFHTPNRSPAVKPG
jgi:hypothetical protein